MVERFHGMEEATGSNPVWSTNNKMKKIIAVAQSFIVLAHFMYFDNFRSLIFNILTQPASIYNQKAILIPFISLIFLAFGAYGLLKRKMWGTAISAAGWVVLIGFWIFVILTFKISMI